MPIRLLQQRTTTNRKEKRTFYHMFLPSGSPERLSNHPLFFTPLCVFPCLLVGVPDSYIRCQTRTRSLHLGCHKKHATFWPTMGTFQEANQNKEIPTVSNKHNVLQEQSCRRSATPSHHSPKSPASCPISTYVFDAHENQDEASASGRG